MQTCHFLGHISRQERELGEHLRKVAGPRKTEQWQARPPGRPRAASLASCGWGLSAKPVFRRAFSVFLKGK